MTTYRITIQPEAGAARVVLTQLPALSVRITTGGVPTDISGKVDKVNGKGLSTEDYTTAEKSKLAGLGAFSSQGYTPNFFYGLSNGETPPLPGPTLQAEVDALILAGMDAQSAFYIYTGVEDASALTATAVMPVVSAQMVIVAPSTVSVRTVSSEMPAVALPPVVVAPTMSTVSEGSATSATLMPSVAVQPVVTANTGESKRVAMTAMPVVSTQPVVAANGGDAARTTATSMPTVSIQSVLAVNGVDSVRTVSATMPSVSLQPAIASMIGASASEGSVNATAVMPSVSITPQVVAPSGVSASSAAIPTVSAQLVISAPTALTAQTVSGIMPSATVHPSTLAPTVSAVRTAATAMPTTSSQPVVTAAVGTTSRRAVTDMPGVSLTPAIVAPVGAVSVASSAPTQPVITAVGGNTQVTITLESGGIGATSYELKYRVSGGTYGAYVVATLPHVQTGLTNGTTYDFVLKAINAQGFAESEPVSEATNAAAVTVSDDFNRADGPLGSNWAITSGSASISVNQAYIAGRAQWAGPETIGSNQFAQIEALVGNLPFEVLVRALDVGNNYRGEYGYDGDEDTDYFGIYKTVGGAQTTLVEVYGGVTFTYLRMEAQGSLLTFKHSMDGENWSDFGSVADESLTSGNPGFGGFAGIDNFVGGDL